MQVNFRITDSSKNDFQRTLKRYLQVSQRDLSEALNEKGYFIAGSAIYHTHKADAERIKAELGVESQQVIGKRGKALKKKKLGFASKYHSTLAVKIIIARLRKAGKAIPSAAELSERAVNMVRSRIRSVAFIRSGWLPALRKLARYSKYGAIKFETPKQYGVAKGGVSPATESQGDYAKCVIWNSAGGEGKHKGALFKYGQPGLQAAVDEEVRGMKKYIEDRMRKKAQEVGIKTN